MIVVAKSGGDFTDPVEAMNSTSDASANNSYLIKLMPGVYDLGTNNPLRMKEYVDIVGSGTNTTSIIGTVTDVYQKGSCFYSALIVLENYSELSRLSIISNASAGVFGGDARFQSRPLDADSY